MNICLVTPAYRTPQLVDSGLGNHFSDLARTLASLNHNVHVLYVTGKDGDEPDEFLDEGAHVHVLKAPLPAWLQRGLENRWAQHVLLGKGRAMLLVSKALSRIVREHKIDVIETTSYDSLCLPYLLKRKRPPVVTRVSITLQQIIQDHYKFSSKSLEALSWLEKQMVHRSDHLITHTAAHRDIVSREFGVPAERFKLITHGINVPKLSTNGNGSDGNGANAHEGMKAHDGIDVLYVGRFEYRKGADVLMEAIPLVLSEIKGVQFTLAGSDQGGAFEKEFKERWGGKFDSRVRFCGRVDDPTLQKLYAECDIFAAPSRYESFGLIYAEVMSYGKPVIGCLAGGVPEVVEHGVTGLLTAPGSVAELAESIIKLARDESLRGAMGARGRERVERLFTKEAMAERTLENYRQLLSITNR